MLNVRLACLFPLIGVALVTPIACAGSEAANTALQNTAGHAGLSGGSNAEAGSHAQSGAAGSGGNNEAGISGSTAQAGGPAFDGGAGGQASAGTAGQAGDSGGVGGDAGTNAIGGQAGQLGDAGQAGNAGGTASTCQGWYSEYSLQSLKEASGQGSCTNDDDLLASCTADLSAMASACYVSCLVTPKNESERFQCALDCIKEQAQPDPSDACNACYLAFAQCTFDSCREPCTNEPKGQECVKCSDEHSCSSDFYDCSGLPELD